MAGRLRRRRRVRRRRAPTAAATPSARQHLPHRLDDQADRGGSRADPRRGVPAAARRSRRRPAARARRPPRARRRPRAARRRRPSPAQRPITVHDVLTFRLGGGWTSTAPWPQPLLEAMGELGLGAGRRRRSSRPTPDEWIRRLGTLPLLYQPGERWLYNTGSDVLGVLIARAAGSRSTSSSRARVRTARHGRHRLLRQRTSTASARATRPTRRPASRRLRPTRRSVGDSAGVPVRRRRAGSTVDDVHAFGRMLLSGGRSTRRHTAALARVRRSDDDRPDRCRAQVCRPSIDGSQGWGFGVGVQVRRTGLGPTVGGYGWAGGLGSSWANEPASAWSAWCSRPTRSRRRSRRRP